MKEKGKNEKNGKFVQLFLMLVRRRANRWRKTSASAVADSSVLLKFFVNNTPKIIKKSRIRTKPSSQNVDNDISLKANCLEQSNTGHFAIEVTSTLVLLVTSLCTARCSLFKHCEIPELRCHWWRFLATFV